MDGIARMRINTLLFLAVGALVCAPAFADKPSWAGGGKDDGYEQGDRHNERHEDRERSGSENAGREHSDMQRHERFSERDRSYIREYYDKRIRSGRCPPGLAKKHNGCMPPGQAKKWKLGQPLPRDVIYYNLPRRVAADIGPPPAGHRYVRVANDILLIAVGTGMVVDAINDLGRQ